MSGRAKPREPAAPWVAQPWAAGPVVVFDTETTGCTVHDRVVSLGAVRLDAGLEPEATLHLAFAPGMPCHWGATRVHGMSDAFLARHPPFAAHAAEIADFFAGALGCAHNLAFDRRMLGNEFARAGLPRPWEAELCTMRTWRRAFPGQRAGLNPASAACGFSREGSLHGALEDAWLAVQLLRRLHDMPPVPMRLHGITNGPEGDAMAA